MTTIHVAFLWHMHQPCYKDLSTGRYLLPWVRLHGIKDYYGMPLLVERVEGMRATFNLVPSLLVQLEEYASGRATDRWMEVFALPAGDLPREEALFALDNFFPGNRRTMVDPHPRYRELYERRGFGRRGAEEALRLFDTRDLRDLQVWSLLVWFHPLAVERYPLLGELLEKGKDFSEEDKQALLEVQRAVLGEVLPTYRRLAEAGVVELTTSPFYHPILPLLVDMESAREALPGVRLPERRRSVVEDARWQVRQAVEFHREVLGRAPRGMWPAEGAVSQNILPLLAEAGLEWLASDEGVLSRSLRRPLHREADGSLPPRDAQLLYRAWRVEADHAELKIIFRDQYLSDLIGFQYQRADPRRAAEDFLGRLHRIARRSTSPDCLVPVILDGENAWEGYLGQGVEFLERLYRGVVSSGRIDPTPVSEFLSKHPPERVLPRLAAGSWINQNFAIWVGHHEDNRAWNCVFAAREFLEKNAPQNHPQAHRAWQEIYIAEGSDWFWWYGPEHSSGQDALFDLIFRTHLKNVYRFIGREAPAELEAPVIGAGRLAAYTLPRCFLEVRVEGRDSNYFEWLGAGHLSASDHHGAMHRSAARRVSDLHFGFDERTLFLKLSAHGTLREVLGGAGQVLVQFTAPRPLLLKMRFSDKVEADRVEAEDDSGAPVEPTGVRAALETTCEVAVPFELIGASPGEEVRFAVTVLDAHQLSERIPETGEISFACPSPDFEQINWQA